MYDDVRTYSLNLAISKVFSSKYFFEYKSFVWVAIPPLFFSFLVAKFSPQKNVVRNSVRIHEQNGHWVQRSKEQSKKSHSGILWHVEHKNQLVKVDCWQVDSCEGKGKSNGFIIVRRKVCWWNNKDETLDTSPHPPPKE